MKTKEELKAFKAEMEAMKEKLAELTDEELAQVIGSVASNPEPPVDILPNIVLPSDGTLNTMQ